MRDKGQDPENQLRAATRSVDSANAGAANDCDEPGNTRSATVADLSHSTSICCTVRGHRRSRRGRR